MWSDFNSWDNSPEFHRIHIQKILPVPFSKEFYRGMRAAIVGPVEAIAE